ncbi:MAG: hypothetical protein Cons2KO_30360 [Congregibacter sp.]
MELVFNTCAHFVALLPGLPGAFIRRSFYTLTLDDCSQHCHIGFGSLFAHRQVRIADHVYIGSYALFGSVSIEENALIGSRTSVLSGQSLHELDESGQWSAYEANRLEQVCIGANTWVGEAAVISANVGAGCMIGAGSVVSTPIRDKVLLAGNPARFVRHLGGSENNDE